MPMGDIPLLRSHAPARGCIGLCLGQCSQHTLREPVDEGSRCRRLLHRCGNDNEVVLCPAKVGLKASVAEDVQQFIRAADNAVCSIHWGRLGDRSVRFYDIGQHEPSALGQPLRYTEKQVCLQRPVDVMQSKCGDNQLEGTFWESILKAPSRSSAVAPRTLAAASSLSRLSSRHTARAAGCASKHRRDVSPVPTPGHACKRPLDPLTRERFPAGLGHAAAHADPSGAA